MSETTGNTALTGRNNALVMCKHCNGSGEMHISDCYVAQCPVCSKTKTDEEFISDAFALTMRNIDRHSVKIVNAARSNSMENFDTELGWLCNCVASSRT